VNSFTEFRHPDRAKPDFVTQFGDTEVRTNSSVRTKKMSEYYLADVRAEERARQKQGERQGNGTKQAQDVKITLLGDFLFPSQEPQGFDPYDHVNGKTLRDAWKSQRHR
jgi:hypothetical protein